MSPTHFTARPKRHLIYDVATIKAWEKRWFDKGNSSYGLMSQAAYLMACQIEQILTQYSHHADKIRILVCCGFGNNGGDGYLVAYYLVQMGYKVAVFAPDVPVTADCIRAYECAVQTVRMVDEFELADVYIDALFGSGLDRQLGVSYVNLIGQLNHHQGLKISLDVPSGLMADTGYPVPVAVLADITLCVIGLKMGLLTGCGRSYAGRVIPIPVIAPDVDCCPVGYLDATYPSLPSRPNHIHKGDLDHVLIIGGHHEMGGAVIMAGEAAMAVGAGKVTIMCHKNHHTAILARSPNVMVKDIDEMMTDTHFLDKVDTIAFGMGLGRDMWGQAVFERFMVWLLGQVGKKVVLDADGLYWLANHSQTLPDGVIGTPHASEAGRLLNMTSDDIDKDRHQSVLKLRAKYGGDWVLKGAGTLVLEQDKLFVCPFGNPMMATAGMGDVLSGVIAGLVEQVGLSDCVKIHALAGDELAKGGQVLAWQMAGALGGICTYKH